MADRGIEVVRAHLAKLPPPDSLSIAEHRAQYERAERVFPIPPDVAVERVTRGRARPRNGCALRRRGRGMSSSTSTAAAT